MSISDKEYGEMAKSASPKSKSIVNIPSAFVIGGVICMLGEFLLNLFGRYGFAQRDAGAWTSLILIALSGILTGLGIYEKIAKHGGAGTLVPITGFANSVVSPALEFKSEGYILGLGAKIFIISGPVILYGTVASVVYGLIYYFFLR